MNKTPSSTTIRISRDTHEMLKDLARQQDRSLHDVIETALQAYRQRVMMQEMNEDFTTLKKNKKAWESELKERRLWDNTLSDGQDID